MVFPKTDISRGWGAYGTEGGASASFFKRYYTPLIRYGCYKFGIDEERSEELVAAYVARELERDRDERRAIFRLYDADRGRFRSLLATSFWRFARDALNRESRSRPLPEAAEPAGEDYEFCRLVAREFFNDLRGRIAGRLVGEEEAAVLVLKWPEDPDREPAANAVIERELGLSRARVRTIVARIADRFTFALNEQLHAAGLPATEARALLGDCCRVLDREQAAAEAR